MRVAPPGLKNLLGWGRYRAARRPVPVIIEAVSYAPEHGQTHGGLIQQLSAYRSAD